MKKVSLNGLERVVLMGLLPKANNFVVGKIIREKRKQLGFSEVEMVKVDGKPDGSFDTEKAEKLAERVFEFGEFTRPLIEKRLAKLDEERKMNDVHVDLFEKFGLSPKKSKEELLKDMAKEAEKEILKEGEDNEHDKA